MLVTYFKGDGNSFSLEHQQSLCSNTREVLGSKSVITFTLSNGCFPIKDFPGTNYGVTHYSTLFSFLISEVYKIISLIFNWIELIGKQDFYSLGLYIYLFVEGLI